MNDEAAEPRGPSTPGAGPQGEPASSEKPPADDTTTTTTPPPPPTGSAFPPNAGVPPWLSSAGAAFARQQLVRPRNGRYVAGVCGALARATNTDPVLWRVMLAVLGILGGTGVLLYLIGWLIIPSEGDSASPIESLLGKGQSGMAPFSVVLLGGAALLTFAFIVNSGARASMLAAAVIIGAFLLIKRGGVPSRETTFPAAPPPPAPTPPAPPTAEEPTMAFTPPAATAPTAEPVTAPPAPPRYEPPTGGFRPPFAPHGPYAGSSNLPPQPPAPVKPAKPPKPPKERSVLGRLTFFAVLVAMGVLAALDMAGMSVAVSAYFALALATIALGLIVGTWFGRARGLIALAVLVTFGLIVSTGVERFGQDFTPSVYRPASLAEVADRYDFTFGNVTLDLRQVDFAGAEQSTTVTMKLGQLRVLLPPEVDTTADVRLDGGRTLLFGNEFNDAGSQSASDLGIDGAGGGTLLLNLQMEAGNLEVAR
ncbi:PspC domain-containing protein [Actinoplanes aureus]|uniref:PspC domain-containing protein n=1 Tax=Actinoplanes aureus TaxID=2792083 RepID=A0A931CBV6_9ACTN|nr:PspC domain-containing protein [Actinoplanes aureus]MBG0563268.1 PspC domain-containing protein [Actinoplanes aureus]